MQAENNISFNEDSENIFPEKNINRHKKAVFGWTMYDWANSVFALAITTAIFPTYYNQVSKADGVMLRMENNMPIVNFLGFEVPSVSLYSYSLSFAFLLITILSPFLGAIADYSGSKKKFMFGFCLLGSAACSLLYFFTPETFSLGILLFILAALGYAGGNIFNDAFLPEITTPDQYAKVSARGFAMGYIGSIIQLVICLALIMKFELFGFSNALDATRVSFLLVGLWWFGFAQVTFMNLKDVKPKYKVDKIFQKGFSELGNVMRSLKANKKLKGFLTAFLFYNMGMQTVLYMASLFGTVEMKLQTPQLIMTVLLIQFIAIFGAHLFASLSKSVGNLKTLIGSLFIWTSVCVVAYFITLPVHFYAIAACVGLIMGGTQALSRATYSSFIPLDTKDNASFFSFYAITDKISIILGLFVYGWVNQITQNMRTSILFLILFFVLGGIMLFLLQKKEARE